MSEARVTSKSSHAPPKPPELWSAHSKGAGLVPGSKPWIDRHTYHLVRNNFEISTWVLFGAALQSVLILFRPMQSQYVLGLPFAFLAIKSLYILAMLTGLMRNPMIRQHLGVERVSFPPGSADSTTAKGGVPEPGNGEVCVALISFQCHSYVLSSVSFHPNTKETFAPLLLDVSRWHVLFEVPSTQSEKGNGSDGLIFI